MTTLAPADIALIGNAGQTYRMTDHDTVMGESSLEPAYALRVKDLDEDERPRERLLAAGPQSLSLADLVAVLWGVGTRKEDVLAMSRRTLREYGEKAVAHESNPHRLAEAADIPLNKACQLVAGFELGRRFHAKSGGRPVQVRNLQQAYQYLQDMGQSSKEQLRGLYLNSRYHVIHDEVISVGTLTSNLVHPREVFQPAVMRGAAAVIIAHNHPSDVLTPTAADIRITAQLKAAGEMLGISLLDHLIVGSKQCISIMEVANNE